MSEIDSSGRGVPPVDPTHRATDRDPNPEQPPRRPAKERIRDTVDLQSRDRGGETAFLVRVSRTGIYDRGGKIHFDEPEWLTAEELEKLDKTNTLYEFVTT